MEDVCEGAGAGQGAAADARPPAHPPPEPPRGRDCPPSRFAPSPSCLSYNLVEVPKSASVQNNACQARASGHTVECSMVDLVRDVNVSNCAEARSGEVKVG